MKRLIEKGLMFGNLVPVTSGALVERYNRALKSLTGKQTKLTDFHVDISGYSPEIGDEFDDQLYLNPNGCNRQFILLSTAQKSAPLLNAKFSTSRPILKRFIAENESELFALTTRDAVAGELANSIYDLSTPERLFDIRRITVEADTTGSHVAEGRKLAEKIDRFKNEDDAWWDDVLIADMITLAKRTGDVTRNPITLDKLAVEHRNFWTAHFGGVYLFGDLEHPATVSVGPKEKLGKLPTPHLFDLQDRTRLARFLELNGLAEPIVRAKNVDAGAILAQKMDFILVAVGGELGLDLGDATRRDLRKLAQKLGARLPEEFHGLAALKRWVESGGDWPRINSEHPAYFYTLRAAGHSDRVLVNQLLAELTPLDVRQLFICHKQLFYSLYADWPEQKKEFVANFLEREYQVDKVGVREALFGDDDTMDEPDFDRFDKLIDSVGPWGSFRRRAKRWG
ncbi:MAG: DUF6638 family protein [Paracoccaceae bacterium]